MIDKNMHAASEDEILRSRLQRPGGDHYRAYVGPPDEFDFMGATQFALAIALGLREEHRLLDVGCGSLRAGRLMLQYLLPGRYFGIEPNERLWREIVAKEIGNDLLTLKQPRFSANAEFDFACFGASFDMIIAQSIFSHAGSDLFERAVASAAGVLAPDGQFLFTVLSEGTPGFGQLGDGAQSEGWFYPQCVTFRESDVAAICARSGLLLQKLPWFHPRQRWYRAVRSPDRMLADPQTAFRDGRILFDPRFST